MPEGWLGRRHHRHRAKIFPFKVKQSIKPSRRKYLPMVKLLKLFAAILVPLMIGAFTVVTTIQESNSARYQRELDITRVERQAKLQEELEERQSAAEKVKLHEQHDYNDRMAKQIRIQNVFDAFIKDITNIVLKPNNNLTRSELIYARSRTMTAIEQVDLKHKWLIVKYLYDNELLYARGFGYQFVDLGGADLSNIQVGSIDRFFWQLNLQKIRLSSMDLINSSFNYAILKSARFDKSDLTNSSFRLTLFSDMSFLETRLENAEFDLTNLDNVSFRLANLKGTTWTFKQAKNYVLATFIDFTEIDLSEATFSDMNFASTVVFHHTNLERSRFNRIKFLSGLKLRNVSLKMAIFKDITFDNVEFHDSNLSGVIFSNCTFRSIRFFHTDLQNTRFNPVLASSKIDFDSVDLIGSNFHTPYKTSLNVSNSFLPNGTFITSFRSFNVNLLKNSGAEEGECYENHSGNLTGRKNPLNWQSQGNVTQISYDGNPWNIEGVKEEWGSCFFYGGSLNKVQAVSLRQEIDVSALKILINTHRAHYTVSGYLGGIGKGSMSATLRLLFKTGETGNPVVNIGKRNDKDREGRTTMLFREQSDMIPKGTTLIIFDLFFAENSGFFIGHSGIADNASLVIRQRRP